MNNRVVVTGMGAVTSIGTNVTAFWDSLITGVSGVTEIQNIDTTPYKIKHAYEIKDLNIDNCTNNCIGLGRASHFFLIAAQMAMKEAKRSGEKNLEGTSIGCCLGSGLGEAKEFEHICKWIRNGKMLADNSAYNYYCLNPGEIQLARIMAALGLTGEAMQFGCACAAGSFAIAHAYQQIKNGRYNLMVAGGTDAISLGSLVYHNRLFFNPPNHCTPFDKNRKGMMLGEGAGVLVLEERKHALKRNAKIYGEILSYGISCDAYHITQIELQGIVKVMEKAIRNANILPSDIQYICAHGTGTILNDKVETNAIKNVYGQSAYNIPVSSIKAQIGHTAGASGPLGVIATLKAINNQCIPPTINYQEKDPDCDLDYVPNIARHTDISIAQVNAFGFGGNNCSLIVAA
jgi:3-oxoacyl-[acyl-carrier-protein] synthase II